MVHRQQQKRLHQLRLNGRRAHCEDGLLGENGRPLGYRPDVAGKAEPAQILQKLRRKQVPAPEIGNVFGIKVQILDIVDDLLQPCRNGKPPVIRAFAEKYVEVANAVLQSTLKVSVSHGQLIKVAEHGQIQLFFGFHTGTSHGALKRRPISLF